jgi:ABC-2 type transport system ATP-binding protein
MHAVTAEGLTKRYRTTTALDRFDLAVAEGTLCGLLGPNGAGKTTAVRILTTLLRPDAGRATVAGHDVERAGRAVRERIGLVGQHAALDEVLTGRQNLALFGRLHHLPGRGARARAGELLHRFGLDEAADRAVSTYSGGMRRRLDLAAGLITSPRVLFLDEPTAGLDPRGRTEVWDAVRALVGTGTTVLLTTQYLEEADQLATRVCVVDRGRVIAEGTPDALKARLGGDRVEVVLADRDRLADAAALLERMAGTAAQTDPDVPRVGVPVRDRTGALTAVVKAMDEAGIVVADVALRRPTLDEVFCTSPTAGPARRCPHEGRLDDRPS